MIPTMTPGTDRSQAAPAANLLHPAPATAEGQAKPLGWALRPRALLLLLAGSVCVLPVFFLHVRTAVAALLLLLWNTAVLAAAAVELHGLPKSLTVTRRFPSTLALGHLTAFELEVLHSGKNAINIVLTDALHPALSLLPVSMEARVFPYEATAMGGLATPTARGDYPLGPVFCRLRGALKLAERWIVAAPSQNVRIYPSAVRTDGKGDLPLLHARQMELERRRSRRKGAGREFGSLREYQPGDALRDLSWTASARRGKLITRQFTTERSQQVWVVLDAGRLSQTVVGGAHTQGGGTHTQGGGTHTQLDGAASAALLLARAVSAAGDKVGLLAYGRTVRQQLLPGSGAGHLRLLVDLLAQVKSERGEANHLRAVARFKSLQRTRSLVVWITEVSETAGRPEIAAAVAELNRHHLPLLLLLEHPELATLSNAEAKDADAMFAIAAAREMEERRSALVADLRRSGAMAVRTASATLAADAIRTYLKIKADGLL